MGSRKDFHLLQRAKRRLSALCQYQALRCSLGSLMSKETSLLYRTKPAAVPRVVSCCCAARDLVLYKRFSSPGCGGTTFRCFERSTEIARIGKARFRRNRV